MIMEDGFPTKFTAVTAGFTLWKEKTVTPPGVDGGGTIDVVTMHNTAWRTVAFKKLKTLTPMSGSGAYDPAVLSEILAAINVNQSWEVEYPDLSTITFWGALTEATPNEISEGEQPTMDFTITPSNRNGSGAETPPVYAPPPGP
jgi:hypothetical protein